MIFHWQNDNHLVMSDWHLSKWEIPQRSDHHIIILTPRSTVLHLCVAEQGHHWFRWLVACLVQSHYLNQWGLIINHTPRNRLQWKNYQKLINFHWCNCNLNLSLILPPFVQGEMGYIIPQSLTAINWVWPCEVRLTLWLTLPQLQPISPATCWSRQDQIRKQQPLWWPEASAISVWMLNHCED